MRVRDVLTFGCSEGGSTSPYGYIRDARNLRPVLSAIPLAPSCQLLPTLSNFKTFGSEVSWENHLGKAF